MKKSIIIFIVTLCLLPFTLCDCNSQSPDAQISLEKLFGRLVTSHNDRDKIKINDSIELMIDGYSRSDTIFTHKFRNLKYLGQIATENSQLKILTWNLLLDSAGSKYFCYFIHRSANKNSVRKLEKTYSKEPVRSDTVYSEKNWYGALYYDMRSVGKGNKIHWVLLGIDYGNPSVTRKIIDVVSFNPDGTILFGKKIFVSGEITKFREVLEYSSDAVISLKFASQKSIVFDHLVPVSPAFKGNREYYGPDYSYDAYNLQKGVWKLDTNVDVRNRK